MHAATLAAIHTYIHKAMHAAMHAAIYTYMHTYMHILTYMTGPSQHGDHTYDQPYSHTCRQTGPIHQPA